MAVRDNGVGVPEDFDGDSQQGLGLSIIRGLVTTELTGSIEVRRRADTSGSEALIEVPLPPQLGQLVRELRATSRWPSSTNLSASSVAFTTQLATLLFRSPAHTPESWLVFNANSRHMSFTEQSTHTALAAAICRNALPVEPIGKRKRGVCLPALGGVSPHAALQQHRSSSAHVSVSSRCYP